MPVHKVNHFPPGSYVEHVDEEWIGTVLYLTMTEAGQPALIVRAVRPQGFEIITETLTVNPDMIKRLDEDTVLPRVMTYEDVKKVENDA